MNKITNVVTGGNLKASCNNGFEGVDKPVIAVR